MFSKLMIPKLSFQKLFKLLKYVKISNLKKKRGGGGNLKYLVGEEKVIMFENFFQLQQLKYLSFSSKKPLFDKSYKPDAIHTCRHSAL